MSGYCLGLLFVREIPVVNANTVDPDQAPRSAVSDLVLHCLQRSHLWDARPKWVKLVAIQIILLEANGFSKTKEENTFLVEKKK